MLGQSNLCFQVESEAFEQQPAPSAVVLRLVPVGNSSGPAERHLHRSQLHWNEYWSRDDGAYLAPPCRESLLRWWYESRGFDRSACGKVELFPQLEQASAQKETGC